MCSETTPVPHFNMNNIRIALSFLGDAVSATENYLRQIRKPMSCWTPFSKMAKNKNCEKLFAELWRDHRPN